jgi:hypothetical protein
LAALRTLDISNTGGGGLAELFFDPGDSRTRGTLAEGRVFRGFTKSGCSSRRPASGENPLSPKVLIARRSPPCLYTKASGNIYGCGMGSHSCIWAPLQDHRRPINTTSCSAGGMEKEIRGPVGCRLDPQAVFAAKALANNDFRRHSVCSDPRRPCTKDLADLPARPSANTTGIGKVTFSRRRCKRALQRAPTWCRQRAVGRLPDKPLLGRSHHSTEAFGEHTR